MNFRCLNFRSSQILLVDFAIGGGENVQGLDVILPSASSISAFCSEVVL
jgi:hypothetical protein